MDNVQLWEGKSKSCCAPEEDGFYRGREHAVHFKELEETLCKFQMNVQRINSLMLVNIMQ